KGSPLRSASPRLKSGSRLRGSKRTQQRASEVIGVSGGRTGISTQLPQPVFERLVERQTARIIEQRQVHSRSRTSEIGERVEVDRAQLGQRDRVDDRGLELRLGPALPAVGVVGIGDREQQARGSL